MNAVADVVRSFPGARASFGHAGSGHQVAEIEFKGRRRKLFFSGTPSCRHAADNAARQTRRILTELKAQQEGTT